MLHDFTLQVLNYYLHRQDSSAYASCREGWMTFVCPHVSRPREPARFRTAGSAPQKMPSNPNGKKHMPKILEGASSSSKLGPRNRVAQLGSNECTNKQNKCSFPVGPKGLILSTFRRTKERGRGHKLSPRTYTTHSHHYFLLTPRLTGDERGLAPSPPTPRRTGRSSQNPRPKF